MINMNTQILIRKEFKDLKKNTNVMSNNKKSQQSGNCTYEKGTTQILQVKI